MIPANIISGFRTCGVYPFNPKAVLDHNPCVSKNNNPKSTDGNNPTDSDLLSGSNSLPKRSRKKCPSKSTSSLPSTHLRDKPGTSAAIAESCVASLIQDSVLLCYPLITMSISVVSALVHTEKIKWEMGLNGYNVAVANGFMKIVLVTQW